MDFTVTITDPADLAGITAAREAYNAALPVPEAVEGEEPGLPAGYLATDEEYVQFVMAHAAKSYARQYGV
jgi:hypothetical protein